MIHNMIGGGAALNFKIICNPQPETARENTIWIDTDDATNWMFSATQPETAEDGMVWIATGISSTTSFNALRKNAVMMYPLTAQQFVDGAWVEKTAKIYQGVEWKSFWNGQLYIRGDEFLPITGGWEPYFDSNWYKEGTFSKKDDRITLSGAKDTFIIAKPVKLVDLTHYNRIDVYLENVHHSAIHLSLVEEGKSFRADNYIADTKLEKTSLAEGIISLDVSTFSGKFQVGCSSAGAMSAAHSIEIVEVQLT